MCPQEPEAPLDSSGPGGPVCVLACRTLLAPAAVCSLLSCGARLLVWFVVQRTPQHTEPLTPPLTTPRRQTCTTPTPRRQTLPRARLPTLGSTRHRRLPLETPTLSLTAPPDHRNTQGPGTEDQAQGTSRQVQANRQREGDGAADREVHCCTALTTAPQAPLSHFLSP